jgi:hypothetical protein
MTVRWLVLGVGLIGFALSIHLFYQKRIEQNERATTDSPEICADCGVVFLGLDGCHRHGDVELSALVVLIRIS